MMPALPNNSQGANLLNPGLLRELQQSPLLGLLACSQGALQLRFHIGWQGELLHLSKVPLPACEIASELPA